MEPPILRKLFTRGEKRFQVKVLPADVTFEASDGKTLLEHALDQGIAYPHKCRSGFCKTCIARLASGRVSELTDKSYVLTDEEMAANSILVCQSVARTDLVLEAPRCPGREKKHESAK